MRIPRNLGAYGVAAVLTLFGGGFVRACASPVTATNDVMKVANSCTTMVNQQRAARGIKAVAIDGRVQMAAQKHSTFQAKYKVMQHDSIIPASSPSKVSAGDRILKEGYRWSTWGENVAAGQTDCKSVMSAWMNSAGHKKNILNPAVKHIGVAAAKGSNGVIYWTMDLAAP
jgi:uncharacterized protein YkwD